MSTTWKIDPMHSEAHFSVKHLVISTVSGEFKTFDGQLETTDGDTFTGAKVTFSADVASISTNNEQRDGHLKSPEFFDAEQFPKLSFASSSFTSTDDKHYTLVGDLTIKGTTKPLTLTVEYGGTMVDGYGNTKAGFEIAGVINRKEYGLTWSAVTEAGGVVVSDDVKLMLSIQVARQAA
jgi:polyisoprenoid-binding protein YceI